MTQRCTRHWAWRVTTFVPSALGAADCACDGGGCHSTNGTAGNGSDRASNQSPCAGPGGCAGNALVGRCAGGRKSGQSHDEYELFHVMIHLERETQPVAMVREDGERSVSRGWRRGAQSQAGAMVVGPNNRSNSARSTMSTSGMVTGRPRSTSDVTPWAVTPHGTMPEK